VNDMLSEIREAAIAAAGAQRNARPAAQAIGRDLPASLPGQPGYRERIPPPDGPAIGEVGPDGTVRPPEVPVVDPSPFPSPGLTAAAGAPTLSTRRVVIYCGRRDDDFILSVETSPDEDPIYNRKFNVELLLCVLDVVRSLGVRIVDRTGGELKSYEIALRARDEQAPARAGAGEEGGGAEPSGGSPLAFHPHAERTG